jgi:hypothetical protein
MTIRKRKRPRFLAGPTPYGFGGYWGGGRGDDDDRDDDNTLGEQFDGIGGDGGGDGGGEG